MKVFRYGLQKRGLCSELNSVLGIYQECRRLGAYSFIHGTHNLYFQKIRFWDVFKPNETLKELTERNENFFKQSSPFSIPLARRYAWKTYKQTMSQIEASKALVFQDNFQKDLNQIINSVRLPKKFIAMHIRWGDKVGDVWDRETILRGCAEANKKNFKDYFRPIKDVPIGTIFIMTDDIQSIKHGKRFFRSRNLPYRIKFLTRPNQRGRSESQDLDQNKQYSRQELLQIFAEIEIAKRSQFFVGTNTSNIYRYIKNTCTSGTKFISLD